MHKKLYLAEKSLRDKARNDPPLATVRFKPGDHVLLKRPADQKHSKMDFPYYNTVYAVKSVLERERYQLETVHGRPITHAKDTVHVSRLKRMPSYALRAVEDSGVPPSGQVPCLAGRAWAVGGRLRHSNSAGDDSAAFAVRVSGGG